MPARRKTTTELGRQGRTHEIARNRRLYQIGNTDAFGWAGIHRPTFNKKPFPFFSWDFARAWPTACSSNNTYRSSFDFGKESADYLSFGAEGGETELLFHRGARNRGKNHRAVTPRSTGRAAAAAALDARLPAVPPTATIPEARVREIARLLARKRKIPGPTPSTSILTIRKATPPFTINRQYFPDF